MREEMIRIEQLHKRFHTNGGYGRKFVTVNAVNGISLDIAKGETLGLVGESGCGKSTLGRTILKVYEPDGGKIFCNGDDITHLNNKQMKPYRRMMQMIFQDPYASLNPRFTVGEMIAEPMEIFDLYTKQQRKERVQELLETVGLKPDHIRRYPHEFSGGQRQRIGIARTLALDPQFIVCDEPTSALDVSIRAQIINLLEKIQREKGISYLFIAHDIGMVRHISHRIGVMYMGSLVEIGNADEICERPKHPYTQVLMSAIPQPDPKIARASRRIILEGEVPTPLELPAGCPFAKRCPYADRVCMEKMPEMRSVSAGHMCACHYPQDTPKTI